MIYNMLFTDFFHSLFYENLKCFVLTLKKMSNEYFIDFHTNTCMVIKIIYQKSL
jgi:hypothetical protein